ncbi:MAG: hypothetical protein HPAVJP_3190 [Candidatus Hepatoplasma vulgare]|nr:MAG: hypothetical protein HPAVJP_3190 [Candidatus Hepatoplasma sp.]
MKQIILSNSFTFTKNYIQKIKQEENIIQENIYYFDFLEDEIGKSISKYLSTSIFGEKKIILLKNSNFLNKANLNKNFISYFNLVLKNENKNFLILQIDTLKEKDSFFEKISPFFKLIELTAKDKKFNNITIEKYLKENNIKFDKNDVKQLLKYCNNNFELALNEINKIFLIKDQFNLKTLNKYVLDLKGESFFKLLEALIKKKYLILNEIFKTITDKGISPIAIIESMLKDLEIMINIKLHEKFNIKNDFNFSELNIYPFKIKNLIWNSGYINLKSAIFLFRELLKFEKYIKKNNPDYLEKLFFGNIIYLSKKI